MAHRRVAVHGLGGIGKTQLAVQYLHHRRAEYPELPGCAAEAESAVEAIEMLESERRRLIQLLWDRGAPIPTPRAPLRRTLITR